MTGKYTLFVTFIFIAVVIINAQEKVDCNTYLSLFHEPAKLKKYDEAYKPWLLVKDSCPDLNLAIYIYGEKILKYKIDNTQGEEKKDFIDDLINLWKDRKIYFKSRTPEGEYLTKSCQLLYTHKDLLEKEDQELYQCFDNAFKKDSKSIKNPAKLYTYSHLAVNLFDQGEKSAKELFNTYYNILEKIGLEKNKNSEKLNKLIVKSNNGEALTNSEKRKKNNYETYIKAYKKIEDAINSKVARGANCENLIPLYNKDFEKNKNDSIWLKRAVNRMHQKQCTADDFYEKLMKQYDEVSPSADTKLLIADILLKKEKHEEAYEYLVTGYQLESKPNKKSNLAIKIGDILKSNKKFNSARTFFLKSMELNPSNGKPHFLIAQMYANSAKDCGKDNYHKRAVFWLAAQEAKKASKVDPTLQEIANQYEANYLAKAPSKEKGFILGTIGKTIKIKCWINRSVTVPD